MAGFSDSALSTAGCRSVLALSVWVLAACASLGSNPKPDASTAEPGKFSTALLDATNGAEWKGFLPPGAIPVASANGDLDADGDEDTLVIYAPSPQQDEAPRTLLVLLREPGGVLRPALTNPKAILCSRCGGMMGDPLQPIQTVRGGFTLRFEGGSRELWFTVFRFAHIKAGGWRLVEIDGQATDRIGGASAQKRLSPTDFGIVKLDVFDPRSFPVDALP
jgi:hypothetical protein